MERAAYLWGGCELSLLDGVKVQKGVREAPFFYVCWIEIGAAGKVFLFIHWGAFSSLEYRLLSMLHVVHLVPEKGKDLYPIFFRVTELLFNSNFFGE